MDKIVQEHMGGIQNKLRMLSDDCQFLIPKRFFNYYAPFTKTEIAKKTGINRKTLYRDKIKLSTLKDLKIGIIQVVMGTDLAIEAFKEDTDKALRWFQTPNNFLFGDTPFEVCIRGDGKLLIEWLLRRLGKKGILIIEKKETKKTS